MSKKAKGTNVVKAEMTDAEKAIKAEARAKKLAARKEKAEMLTKVLAFAIEKAEVESNDEIAILAKRFMPSTKGGATRGAKVTLKDFFTDLFSGRNAVSENEVFTNHKLGRAEMRKKCLQAIKKAAPADRVWVKLDYDAGEYQLFGFGAEVPANWVGYKPLDIAGEEIV